MKKYVDMSHREVQFQLGNWGFFKLQPYQLLSLIRLATRPNEKLSPWYYGAYEVMEKIEVVT